MECAGAYVEFLQVSKRYRWFSNYFLSFFIIYVYSSLLLLLFRCFRLISLTVASEAEEDFKWKIYIQHYSLLIQVLYFVESSTSSWTWKTSLQNGRGQSTNREDKANCKRREIHLQRLHANSCQSRKPLRPRKTLTPFLFLVCLLPVLYFKLQ